MPAYLPRPTIYCDSNDRLYRRTPRGIRRCDTTGTPLIRIRLSKKNKLRFRAAGIHASKWIQSTPSTAH